MMATRAAAAAPARRSEWVCGKPRGLRRASAVTTSSSAASRRSGGAGTSSRRNTTIAPSAAQNRRRGKLHPTPHAPLVDGVAAIDYFWQLRCKKTSSFALKQLARLITTGDNGDNGDDGINAVEVIKGMAWPYGHRPCDFTQRVSVLE
jgi:hypothetical protein